MSIYFSSWSLCGHEDFRTGLFSESMTIFTDDVWVYTENHNCRDTFEQATERAADLFPGFREMEVSLVAHPKDPNRRYIRVTVCVDADVNATLEAQHSFESWLLGEISDYARVAIRVVPDYL